MAKIQANYDTETKEFTVNIDGVIQQNICCFNCYSHKYSNGEIEGSCSMDFKSIKENGVRHVHSAYASGKDNEQLSNFLYSSLNKNK